MNHYQSELIISQNYFSFRLKLLKKGSTEKLSSTSESKKVEITNLNTIK